jgi:hypothetical protein
MIELYLHQRESWEHNSPADEPTGDGWEGNWPTITHTATAFTLPLLARLSRWKGLVLDFSSAAASAVLVVVTWIAIVGQERAPHRLFTFFWPLLPVLRNTAWLLCFRWLLEA